MDIKILDEKNAPLLKRKVFNLEVCFSGKTPAKQEVRSSVASMLKVSEELVCIKSIIQEFGEEKAEITAHVYKELGDLRDVEEIKKLKRAKTKHGKKEETKE